MGATKKVKFTGSETDNAFLQTMSGNAPTKATSETTPPAHATAETGSRATEKKTLFNIKVNDSTLKTWKQFCLDYDMTLTAAIKRAMARFMNDIKSGKADL